MISSCLALNSPGFRIPSLYFKISRQASKHVTSKSQCRKSTTLTNRFTAKPSEDLSYSHGSKPIAKWLFFTAGAVAVMVTVGGITRLTRSGLSMTDWKLQGSMPPLTQADWDAEFTRYKQYPEYQQRKTMDLDEFKFIYFWEYSHRMLGRTLGLIYGIPLAIYSFKGMIPRHIRGRAIGLLCLGGFQGLVGWWMVKSGLNEEHLLNLTKGEITQIRVSPYRLAAHLGMAFTTFALLVNTGLSALHGPNYHMEKALASFNQNMLSSAKRLSRASKVTAIFAFVTALSGAFVAGNDAGHAYNVFPKMTYDRWLPEEIFELEPLWRNFFENAATVQATHRTLAFSTLGAVLGTFLLAKKGSLGALWRALPMEARQAHSLTLAIASGQVSLGVSTLLLHVPLSLAAAHQAGALALLGSSVWSVHAMRFARLSAPKIVLNR